MRDAKFSQSVSISEREADHRFLDLDQKLLKESSTSLHGRNPMDGLPPAPSFPLMIACIDDRLTITIGLNS